MANNNPKNRRSMRVRNKIKINADKRLIVFRSNKHMFAQIIDAQGKVLVTAHYKEVATKAKSVNKSAKAALLGELIARKAIKAKIKKVVFDRGPYHYHGRVKALAEAARKGGLIF